ncbi:TPA: hypothetical protein ACJEU7_002454 [Acinetobacter baumannii]|uniref:hypothetical protein n=1 Tax=Acinetobacter baumannii TaxID=470 RepID=UPI0022570DFE|nr:hypothetical protein [Acinetobacter baumannii]MCX3034244.1 hypothetical protein [Acinetobacter baumannii]
MKKILKFLAYSAALCLILILIAAATFYYLINKEPPPSKIPDVFYEEKELESSSPTDLQFVELKRADSEQIIENKVEKQKEEEERKKKEEEAFIALSQRVTDNYRTEEAIKKMDEIQRESDARNLAHQESQMGLKNDED